MRAFCEHFGTSKERLRILDGLLKYRAELRTAQLNQGFQWINGSFTEDIELTQDRAPADIDVVTFAHLGDEARQTELVGEFFHLFNTSMAKRSFWVDAHFVNLSQASAEEHLIPLTTYWYSMWSHQRDSERWKGFMQVPLVSDDEEAQRWVEHTLASLEEDR